MEFDSKSYLRALHLQRYDVRSVHHGIQITIGSQGREGRGMGWARGAAAAARRHPIPRPSLPYDPMVLGIP